MAVKPLGRGLQGFYGNQAECPPWLRETSTRVLRAECSRLQCVRFSLGTDQSGPNTARHVTSRPTNDRGWLSLHGKGLISSRRLTTVNPSFGRIWLQYHISSRVPRGSPSTSVPEKSPRQTTTVTSRPPFLKTIPTELVPPMILSTFQPRAVNTC